MLWLTTLLSIFKDCKGLLALCHLQEKKCQKEKKLQSILVPLFEHV